MTDAQALLAAALVGTARTTPPAHAGTPLADALNRVTGPDPEGTLLARAGLTGLAAVAGRAAPATPGPLPAPAPAESRPEAPARAARHLPLLLDTPLLPEWLTLCARAGCRVPPEVLPDLLDAARQRMDLRDLLAPVLGERGAWLAAFHPDWRFTPRPFDPDAWLDATDAEKDALFRALRAADPDQAAALLRDHFTAERATVRRRLLQAVHDTLTPADAALEPLLDAALTDRSADVQALARRALQRLPGSAFNARMARRATHALDGSVPGRPALRLPAPPDPDLKRDGFETGLTAKGFLWHVLAHTHPDVLLGALHLDPPALVALAGDLDAHEELRRAALAVPHPALAQALIPHLKDTLPLRRLAATDPLQAARDALHAHDTDLLHALLPDLPAPWPADLTGALLPRLAASLRRVEYPYAWPAPWRDLHALLLVRADPLGPPPAPLPEDATAFARSMWDDLTSALHTRARLMQDFHLTEGARP